MRRIIVCLDVKGRRVVKGTQFIDLRDVGDPVELAERYEREGADEIVFLDISASTEDRATLLDIARHTAERLFIPLIIGGGVRSIDDVSHALRAGADKVSINTAAVKRPEILTEAAERFGAQCVVASIDARREVKSASGQDVPGATSDWESHSTDRHHTLDATRVWRVYTQGGRTPTALDAVRWARECVQRGAGEILLTSIDRDGERAGYDLELTQAVAHAVNVPVIASGGAGSASDILEALREGGADAALVAGILHDGITTVGRIKAVLSAEGIPVRPAA